MRLTFNNTINRPSGYSYTSKTWTFPFTLQSGGQYTGIIFSYSYIRRTMQYDRSIGAYTVYNSSQGGWAYDEKVLLIDDYNSLTQELKDFLKYNSSQEYTVKYDTMYGSRGNTYIPAGEGLTSTILEPMSSSSATFVGWYLDSDYITPAYVGYVPTGDITLYAKWTTRKTIHYLTAHGTAPSDKEVEKGYALTQADLPPLTASGWRFLNWDKPVGYVVNEDTTITASWIQQRTITYSTTHGTAPQSKTVDNGYSLTSNDLPTLDDIQGWHFTGWDKSEGYVVNADTTITAQWEQVTTRTVTYNMGGQGTQIPPQYVIDGQKATRPTDPTATGYRFDDWYTESAYTHVFDFDTPITADRTLYAKWIQLQRHEVTYENDKGETPDDFYFYETHTLTAEELPTYTDDDLIFAGWFDGDVRKLPDDVLTSDTNLVAHWTEKPQPYVEPEPDYNGNRHNEKYTFYRVSGDNWQEHETYDYITGGSVEYSTSTKLKVTAEFDFDGYELPNVNDLLRIYYSFIDDEGVISKNAIATVLVSFAEKKLIDTIKGVETTGRLDGLSVLSILLNAKVGRPYTIKKNANAVFEAEKICKEFGLQVNAEPSSFSLTSDHTFVGGTDYLEIVNWCLTAASFSEAYPDEMGVVQMVSNLSLQNKEESYVFKNDSRSIMLPEVAEVSDWQNAPNVVRLLYNLDDACISSYAKNISGSRASLQSRGNREITYFEEVSDLGVGDKRQSMKMLAETMLTEKSADVEYVTIKHAYIPKICINKIAKIIYEDYEWTGNVDNMSIQLSPSTETETKIKKTLSNEIYIESGAEVLR